MHCFTKTGSGQTQGKLKKARFVAAVRSLADPQARGAEAAGANRHEHVRCKALGQPDIRGR
jgi:hypothetical protein